jgi:phage terminase small subunit
MSERRPRQLTRKQRLFVAEYLVDLNATQAAARAGYRKRSAYSTGHRALRIPAVRAAIEELQAERLERLAMSADEMLVQLSLMARANVLDYLRPGDGAPITDLSELDRDKTAGLSEVTVEDFSERRGENKREGRRLRVKLHDKLHAIDRLIKLYALLGEQVAPEPPAEEVLPAPKHSNRQVARAILAVFRSAQEEEGDEDELAEEP